MEGRAFSLLLLPLPSLTTASLNFRENGSETGPVAARSRLSLPRECVRSTAAVWSRLRPAARGLVAVVLARLLLSFAFPASLPPLRE